jgi:hypothetical protein
MILSRLEKKSDCINRYSTHKYMQSAVRKKKVVYNSYLIVHCLCSLTAHGTLKGLVVPNLLWSYLLWVIRRMKFVLFL